MAGVYTVSQVNAYIKHLFEEDFALGMISIKGEVSNCKYHSSGHIYFTLKDKNSGMAAVMFAGNRAGLDFELRDGQQVVATGTVSVYERDGRYQLYAKKIIPDGEGDLFQRFEALKRELEEMGMFDPEYKKAIPAYARNVGIVTSPTGAAIRDIANISSRRNPYVQLYLCPALVQGDGAVASIVSAIHRLDERNLDVLIVGRGGGSIEDLWAFNEEEVARAVFSCRTPVISAVGHETDVTITDFVADLRAPTPSAAAELAVFDYEQFQSDLDGIRAGLTNRMTRVFDRKSAMLENLSLKLERKSPMIQLQNKRQMLDADTDRMKEWMRSRFRFEKHRLALAVERLNGLSPLNKLESGYSYVSDSSNRNVKSTQDVRMGDILNIVVSDGKIKAEVLEVTDGKKHDHRTGI